MTPHPDNYIVIVRKPCTLKHVSAICNLCQLQLMTDKIFFRPGYGGDRVGAIHSILVAQVKTIDTDWENLRASPGGPRVKGCVPAKAG